MRIDNHAYARVCAEKEALEAKLAIAIEALEKAEQFCVWLCEDSQKNRGMDTGNAAKNFRFYFRDALQKIKGEK